MPPLPDLTTRHARPSRVRITARVILYVTAATAVIGAAWGVDWRVGLVVLAAVALVAEAILAGGAR